MEEKILYKRLRTNFNVESSLEEKEVVTAVSSDLAHEGCQ